MSTSTDRTPAGTPLEEPCRNRFHGFRVEPWLRDQFDPDCPTCFVRDGLKAHDHLHLSKAERAACTATGMDARCKCGAFHH